MSDWWERPYEGGPMVGPDWPRDLYPPDAKPGHTPSKNGDDVEAAKRALWRGGRWPGPASHFDTVYSNAFAHGKTGGNVGDSGMAGFQRQMKIQATGWCGKGANGTANAIRSARIPEGKPNAGQPLLDQTAINLIESAIKKFGKQQKSVRQAALDKAVTQIGVKESPYGSNKCKYTSWYQMVGPWCAMFCTWSFELAAQDMGRDSPAFVKGSYYAYVPYIVNDARNKRRGLSVTSSPQPGDLVCYDWDRDGEFDHVGIFEDGDAQSWKAVEGNTSTSSDSNGGEVMRRSRKSSDGSVLFVRVAEP